MKDFSKSEAGLSHVLLFVLVAAVAVVVGAVGYRVMSQSDDLQSSSTVPSGTEVEQITSRADLESVETQVDTADIDGELNPAELDEDINDLL
jgi:hypothetical protein